MADLIAPIVTRKGTAPAFIDEFGETTWADFNERVNRLIHALRAAGLKSGDTFSLLSGNRRECYEAMVAATHGSWRYVPINWHWVAEEVAYVLDNSDSKVLIADARFAELAADAAARPEAPRLALTSVFGGCAPDGFTAYEELLASGSPDEPADQGAGGPMFYTSGTTGRPKGVRSTLFQIGAPLSHLQLIAQGISSVLNLPADGVTLLEGPLYHSAQWAFSFLPMLGGSALVMRHKFDPAETLALIDRYQVTNLHLVPTQFIRLLRLDRAVREGFGGSSLKVVWHGAAPCPREVKQQMIDWWGPTVCEYYGATEGAFISTITGEEWLAKPGSIGKPLPIIEVIVVKDDGSPANPGETGQLYFRNTMGTDFEYHKDPKKTASAHREPGVFTFGDVGYLDVDGFLYMTDRKIDMIISGGVNIYPAEIEGVLVNHPAVADAAVFGVPNEEFGEEVKAAVELRSGYEPSTGLANELITHCRTHLAGYKAPRSIDFEEELPRHPTGKLYKRLLRERYWKAAGRTI
jgi:long-chain acyl-CoA synthetase